MAEEGAGTGVHGCRDRGAPCACGLPPLGLLLGLPHHGEVLRGQKLNLIIVFSGGAFGR